MIAAAAQAQAAEESYEAASVAQEYEQTPEDMSVLSEAIYDDDLYGSQYIPSARKRKREEEQQVSLQDQEHQIWADQLLDYFMLVDSEDPLPLPPPPPPSINLDRAIDEKGHSALHWASAMGDLDVVRDLINRGARIDNLSNNLETPLMRAVMFTNNYDKNTMGKLIRLLQSTVIKSDWFASTVFHHIAATTSSRNKYLSARYYLDTIINALSETWVPDEITKLLNRTDRNGDTAIHIAARNGARKCVRSLLGRNAAVDIPNGKGETAEHMIRDLNARRRGHTGRRDASSSPFAPDRLPLNGDLDEAVQFVAPSAVTYHSQTANALMTRLAPALMSKVRTLAAAYESEFEEKEIEVRENENVVKKRTAEIEALKKQDIEFNAYFSSLANELSGDTEEQERLREEDKLRQLELEAAGLLEWEQKEMLQSQVSRELSTRQNGNASRSRSSNGVSGEDSMDNRSTLATRLAQAQAERQRLSKDIIRSMSVAGLGERHTDYKRLIHGALGVPEDMTDSMLEDIIGQLEEERRDRMVLEEVA
jgi:transcription factor MBP1